MGKMTIDDIKELQKRFENQSLPKAIGMTVITEDVEVYNLCKVYSDIKIYHLDGRDWREEKI